MKKHELHTLIATLKMIGFKPYLTTRNKLVCTKLPSMYRKGNHVIEIIDFAGYIKFWHTSYNREHDKSVKSINVPLGKDTIKKINKHIKRM
jgi:hypothetical protein